MKRRIMAVFLAIFSLSQLFMTGCSEAESKENKTENDSDITAYDYQIYCISDEGNSLESWGYNASATDKDKVVEEIFSAFTGEPAVSGYSSAVSGKMKKITCVLEDNVVKVNCDKYYDKLDSLSQLFFKTALVMTMTQIEGVEYVYITVKGQPLKDSSGNPVGYFGRSSIVTHDDFIGKNGTVTYTTIYYPNETGDGLVSEVVSYVYDEQQSPAMYIIDMLKKSAEEGANTVIAEDVVINNIFVKDGICYVDFDEKINEDVYAEAEPEMVIYSLVNSLAELFDVTGVQITVNGRADIMFRDEVSLNQIFRMNLNIVE